VKQAPATPKAGKANGKAGKATDKPEQKFEDELMAVAEQLIVKGKEQGYLTPDDILQGFPEIDAEPDQIFRIFAAFKEIGIEVTDGEKDFEEVEQIDDEMLLDIEMMDSVSLDDPGNVAALQFLADLLLKYHVAPDPEGLERTYRNHVGVLLDVPYADPVGIKTLLDDMAPRNPKAAAARRYEYDPSASYADLSKLGFRNTPEADSFVVLKPGESFRLETDFRVHLYDGTKDSRDFLHPGNHILEVRVATWYYYAEPRIYRERWIDKGYLWFQNVTSLPMPFTVERNPVVTPCAD